LSKTQSPDVLSVNGWTLYAHPLFLEQLAKLRAAVERARAKDPATCSASAHAKLLAALRKLMFEVIPCARSSGKAGRRAPRASTGSRQS
jgi:toxin YhaV